MELKNAVLQVRDLLFGENPINANENPEDFVKKIALETDTNEKELLDYFSNFLALKMEVDKLEDIDFERRKVERTGTLKDLAKKNWKKPGLNILNMYWETREMQGVIGDTIEEELQEILQRGGIKYKRYLMNPKNNNESDELEAKRRGRPRKNADDKKATPVENSKTKRRGRPKKETISKPHTINETDNAVTSQKEEANADMVKQKTEQLEKEQKQTKNIVAMKNNNSSKEEMQKKNNNSEQPPKKDFVEPKASIDFNNAYTSFKSPEELDFVQKLSSIARHCITIQQLTEDNDDMNRVFSQLFDGLYVTTYLASKNALKNHNFDMVKYEKEQLSRELELEKAKANQLEKNYQTLAKSILDLYSRDDAEMLELLGGRFESWKEQIYKSGIVSEQKKINRYELDKEGLVVKYG